MYNVYYYYYYIIDIIYFGEKVGSGEKVERVSCVFLLNCLNDYNFLQNNNINNCATAMTQLYSIYCVCKANLYIFMHYRQHCLRVCVPSSCDWGHVCEGVGLWACVWGGGTVSMCVWGWDCGSVTPDHSCNCHIYRPYWCALQLPRRDEFVLSVENVWIWLAFINWALYWCWIYNKSWYNLFSNIRMWYQAH